MRLFSKTQYQMGRQCPRALWLKSHRPELYTSPDSLRTDSGHEVGRLAKVYFGKTETQIVFSSPVPPRGIAV